QIPIIMPQPGESIAQATAVHIAAIVGDQVQPDHDVMEVETNKAVMALTTLCPVRVNEWLVEPQRSYLLGAVRGSRDVTADDDARRRRRCDAAELDAAAGDGRAAGEHRSAARPSENVAPESRAGALRAAGAGAGAGREQRASRPAHWRADRASGGNRRWIR